MLQLQNAKTVNFQFVFCRRTQSQLPLACQWIQWKCGCVFVLNNSYPEVPTIKKYMFIGDSLSYHNGFPFSTYDRDNDNHYRGRNCAQDDHGAWWYNSCQHSNLNGKYLDKGVKDARGVGWYHWKHNHYSMKTASMKLRAK